MAPLEGLVIPRHLAIIMDGNGRWAQRRGLPRIQGHIEGSKATKRAVLACDDIGVGFVSVYAFSAENWKRPEEEVEGLMALIEHSLRREIAELHERNNRFIASGRLGELPGSLQAAIAEGRELTGGNTGLTLNVLVNYGGRAEIVDAARRLAAQAAAGDLDPAMIDEGMISRSLYSPEVPDPDLVLRPGGEFRISNFLLWETAYSEFFIMPVLWPDFRREHLVEAIIQYNGRERRFGGLVEDDDEH
jgi:undecaprenyl diphosphate synthase